MSNLDCATTARSRALDGSRPTSLPADRGHLPDIIARTETEPSLLGVSQHLLAVGWKPE